MSFVANPFAEDNEGEIVVDKKGKNSLLYDFSESVHEADHPSASIISLDIFNDYDHFHKENYFNSLVVLQRKTEHEIQECKTKAVAEELEKLKQYRAELSAIEEKVYEIFQSKQHSGQTVSGSSLLSEPLLAETEFGKVDKKDSDSASLFCDSKLFTPLERNLASTAKACFRKNQIMFLSHEKYSILSSSLSCASQRETLKDNNKVHKESLISSKPGSESHSMSYDRKPSAKTLSSPFTFNSEHPSRPSAFSKTNFLWFLLKKLSIILHYCITGAKNLTDTSSTDSTDEHSLVLLMHTLFPVLLEDISHQINECRENIEATEKLHDACKRLESYGELFPLEKSMDVDSEKKKDGHVSIFFLEKEIEMREDLDDALCNAHQLINNIIEVQRTTNAPVAVVSAGEKDKVSGEMLDEALVGHVVELTSKVCQLHELIKEATNLGSLVRQLRKEVSFFSFAVKGHFASLGEVDQVDLTQKNVIEGLRSATTTTRMRANEYGVLPEVEKIILLRMFAVDLSHRIYELLNEPGSVSLSVTASRNSEREGQRVSSFLNEFGKAECQTFAELLDNFESCTMWMSQTPFLCAEVGLLTIFIRFQDACLHVIILFHHLLLQVAHNAFFHLYLALNQNFTSNEEYTKYSNKFRSRSAAAWSSLQTKVGAEEIPFNRAGESFAECEKQTFLGISEALLEKLHDICSVSSAASTSEAETFAARWGRLRRMLQAHSDFLHSTIEKDSASSSNGRSSVMSCMEGKKRRRSVVDHFHKNTNSVPIKLLEVSTYSMPTNDSKTSSDVVSSFIVLEISNNLLHSIVKDSTCDETRERLSSQQQRNRKEDFNAALGEIESVTDKVREGLQIRQEEATKRMKWLHLQSFGPLLLELVELEERKLFLENLCEQLEGSIKADDSSQYFSHNNDNSEDDEQLKEELAELLTIWAETEEQLHLSVRDT